MREVDEVDESLLVLEPVVPQPAVGLGVEEEVAQAGAAAGDGVAVVPRPLVEYFSGGVGLHGVFALDLHLQILHLRPLPPSLAVPAAPTAAAGQH